MLVSVIIPTFNRCGFVREAVASVCAQRGVASEIIVVDDGSTDGTAAALRSEFRDRVRLINTANRGVAAARNHGVAESCGALIAFLDSDDLWMSEKLRAQLRFFAEHPEAQICQTQEIWVRNGVRVNPSAHHRKPSGDIFEPSLRRCLVSPSAVMMRRGLFERVGGFDEALPVCEDYDLWLRTACTTPVWLIDRALVLKRGGHPDQLSRRHWGMDRFRVAVLQRLLTETQLTPEQRHAALAVLTEKCAILAHGAARRGREAEAEAYLRFPDAFAGQFPESGPASSESLVRRNQAGASMPRLIQPSRPEVVSFGTSGGNGPAGFDRASSYKPGDSSPGLARAAHCACAHGQPVEGCVLEDRDV